jgi:hypothetical protein
MRIITNEMVGAESSRKRLLEAKRTIYEKIRAQLAKERPVEAVCPRMQRTKAYEHGYLTRTYKQDPPEL